MNSIMNIVERHKLISRMPKEKRAELKMILSRTHFYEVRDMGNEQYVLNVIEQGCVVDKIDTEGHLYLMCATSRFDIKMLRYQMNFGEKNEVVVLRTPDDGLTDAEEIVWDRYIGDFCTTINKQLNYKVEFRVQYVEGKTKEVDVARKDTVNVENQAPAQTQIQKVSTPEVVNVSNGVVEMNPLEIVRKAVEGKAGDVLTLTAYARNGKFGIGVDLDTNTVANLIIEDIVDLQEEDVIRATTSVIALSQAIGAYMKLKRTKSEVSYYFFHDRDVYVPIPETFVVINNEDLAMASN